MAKAAERSLVLDTSCLVALVSGWHEHHRTTVRAVERESLTHPRIVVPAHAVLESYAVLTRLPAPHRVSPAIAAELLTTNFKGACRTLSPPSSAVWPFISDLAARGVAGGRSYDAWIVQVARAVLPATLLTWNLAHFAAFGGEGLEVRAPS